METKQTNVNEWIGQELEQVQKSKNAEWFKMEEKVMYEVEVDFSKPFEEQTDQYGKQQRLIPLTYQEKKIIWGMNKSNPFLYKILERGKNGETKFKITKFGSGKQTRYEFMK